MKILRRASFILCLFTSIANTSESSDTTLEPPWRSLLAKSNLSQWQQLGGKAPYDLILDDPSGKIIVGTTIITDENSFLATKETFSDFIFEVDIKVDAGMNSGIQFRSDSNEHYRDGRVHGYQMEVDTSTRRWSGGIYDESRSGWLYNLSRNKKCQDIFNVDTWNIYRIEAVGSRLRTFVNGVPCADLVDEQAASGFIAFQVHSDGKEAEGRQVKWREPRILTDNLDKHATPETPYPKQISYLKNRLTDKERDEGWQLLWSERTPSFEALPNKWRVEEQAIVATAVQSESNFVFFPVNFQHFEFEIDVKVGNELEGGIHYLTKNRPFSGLEFQLADDELNPISQDPKKSLGAIFGLEAPENKSEPDRKGKRDKGKWGWNRVRIVVEHGKVSHWMNNVKIAERQLDDDVKMQSSQIFIEIGKGSMQLRNVKLREVNTNPGDRDGHEMTEVVPRDLIPPSPILNIDQALSSFTLHKDFELEVVAKEPVIFDPVVALYDRSGRIWALEMTTFMPNTQADGEMKHESQIVVLTDTNLDGEMDTRQVIVDKILLPRALAFVQGGILWADNEKLYFSQLDENDEGRFTLVKTDVVDDSYASGGNVEHKPNALLYSLDNWYYNAKSDKRYRPYALDRKIPVGAKEIYRNHLWKMTKSKTEFRGQWGLTQDDYGRHYFNENYTPLQTTSFLPNVANRNAKYSFPNSILAQDVGTADVYPMRVTPGINRGYQEGMLSEDFKLVAHTAASGPLVYRGNQFPMEFYGIGLVQEPAGNLVKATRILESEGVVSGHNLFEKQEIIASTDERFRPVNAVNAPDGTVTIVDFYHGILQHRTYLTTYLLEQIKMRGLERNKHIGRLYRLKHKHQPLPEVNYLDNLEGTELALFLAHDNGWHRDMAQQLIVMKQDQSTILALIDMAQSHADHRAQIKALWTLEGLGIIDFELLKEAVKINNNKVKRSVYRLVELLPIDVTSNIKDPLATWLYQQAIEANAETAPTLSLAAATHNSWPVLSHLIKQFGVSHFTFAALASKEAEFLASEKGNISPIAFEKIVMVADKKDEKIEKARLTGNVLVSFNRGKSLYAGEAGCFACHGSDGKGNQAIPPLNKSEWVTGSSGRLIAILLNGLTGPIEVNGQTYNPPMAMPGLGQNHEMTDQDIADIATYIRYEWNNSALPVSAEETALIRQTIGSQTRPFTSSTLKKLFD